MKYSGPVPFKPTIINGNNFVATTCRNLDYYVGRYKLNRVSGFRVNFGIPIRVEDRLRAFGSVNHFGLQKGPPRHAEDVGREWKASNFTRVKK